MPLSQATKDSNFDGWNKALQYYKAQQFNAATPGKNLIKDLFKGKFGDALKDLTQLMGQADAQDFCLQMINYMEMGWSEQQAYQQYCQDKNI